LFKALDTNGNAAIDMEEFKNGLNHSVALAAFVCSVSDDQLQILQKNHAMLLAAFEYLDKNGNGLIGLKEFGAGIDLLNKRLPDDAGVKDSDELSSVLDIET
jgi:Ca2+-binding EF-hand superfamily protein